jgi:hypothetical protein
MYWNTTHCKLVLKDIGICPLFIACAASDKGLKLYPVIIQYFHLERGKTSAILDLYKVSDVISKAVSGILKGFISKASML